MPPRRRGRATRQIPAESEGQNEEIQRSIPGRRRTRQIDEEVEPPAVQGSRPNVLGAQPPQFPQSSPQQPQQSVQQSGRHIFRPRGHQFKKKQGSSSSCSGSSSSSSSPRAIFYGHCGGKDPSAQCTGVQGA
ncbi:hypothetical protein F511_15131 [Dorcoceras hygrometricum]|uniref:Uncharacterized protein n=1 Tax=Dorcoceras hygrometricum TaxID=472368 RepID=A0A2Z7CC11_9LAMI|nr:hypothetical protein F511_15131 [Dorcoceras hygrometricum]